MAQRPPPMDAPPQPYGSAALTAATTGSADAGYTPGKINRHVDAIRESLSVHSDLMVYLKDVPTVGHNYKALMLHGSIVRSHLNPLDSEPMAIASIFCDLLTAENTPLDTPNDDLGSLLNAVQGHPAKLEAYKGFIKTIWMASDNPPTVSASIATYALPDPAAGAVDPATPATRRLIDDFMALFVDWDNSGIVAMMAALYDVIESIEPKALAHGTLSDLIAGTIAYTSGGEISKQKLTKIRNALRTEHNLEVPVDPNIVKQTYRLIRLCLRGVDIAPIVIVKRLARLFPMDHYLRIHLVIRQSLGVQASMISIIEDALRASLQHPIWPALISRYATEWVAVVTALRTLAQDGYAALGDGSELVKATNFPNFGYTAIQILTRAGHGPTLSRYKGKVTATDPQFINDVLEKYEEAQTQAVTVDTVNAMQLPDWAGLLPDLAIAGRMMRDGTLNAANIL